MLSKIRRRLTVAQVSLEDRVRRIKHTGRTIASGRARPIRTSVRDDEAPWRDISIDPIPMPGMITDEEARYYEWIGTLYEGLGAAIELGPWLGKSTKHIIRGLKNNRQFCDQKLYVFDDFIWRTSWMNQHVAEHERLANHADFRRFFDLHVKDIQSCLIVSTAKIVDYEGNEHLPRIKWSRQPIEIMYIDCGRTFEVNEAWFEVFSECFIPGVTLLVMQDWGTHRERPRLSYNETLLFTNAHPELELIHEVSEGCLATFLYRRR
jgi:hypothetical protein